MSKSNAWLLECGDALTFAVGDHEIVECLQAVNFYPVPAAPHYCSSVIAWQDRLVPVMDIGAIFRGHSQRQAAFVCLLSYQLAPRQPLHYLAVPIMRTPEKIVVDDDQVCEASPDSVSALLQSIAMCCFTHAEQAVPIVDIAKLCSGEFRELAQAS